MWNRIRNRSLYTVEALTTVTCLAFCTSVLLGYLNFDYHKGYYYFVYLYPWLFIIMLTVSVANLAVLNAESKKGIAYRVFNLRLISLFWFIVSISFTMDELNTATMTYFILCVFTIVESLELSEELELQRTLYRDEVGYDE